MFVDENFCAARFAARDPTAVSSLRAMRPPPARARFQYIVTVTLLLRRDFYIFFPPLLFTGNIDSVRVLNVRGGDGGIVINFSSRLVLVVASSKVERHVIDGHAHTQRVYNIKNTATAADGFQHGYVFGLGGRWKFSKPKSVTRYR